MVQVATDGIVQGELPQGILFESNVDNTAGSVSITTASATAADVSSLTIADITFSLVGSPGESSPLTFTEVVASDGAVPPQAIPVVPVDGSLSVRTPNQPPVAMDDTATTKEVAPVNIDVLANDSDPDAGDTLTVVSTTVPANGSVAIEADSTITYTPDPGFQGTDSFDYTIEDSGGLQDTATVSITVEAAPTPTPTPTLTPTPTPTLTPTPTPGPTGIAVPTPTSIPRPTATPFPPLVVVPQEQITPVDPEGGIVEVVHPTMRAVLALPEHGARLTIPAPVQQKTFQVRFKPLTPESLTVQPDGQVLRAIQIELFDVDGKPMQGVRFWFAAKLSFTITEAEVEAMGGLASIFNANVDGSLSIQRFNPSATDGSWGGLFTSFEITERAFSVPLRRSATYALVRSTTAVTPTPTATPTPLPTATPIPSPDVEPPPTGGVSLWPISLAASLLGALFLFGGSLLLLRRKLGA